jgi:glucokinase
VAVQADVRAAAFAEARMGAGRGLGSFVYVTVGTGISSCLVLDGKPHLGAGGRTGTMGSGPLSAWCAARGQVTGQSLESVASGPGLAAQYGALTGRALGSGREVLAAAVAGDAAAIEVIARATRCLGGGIANLVNVLDPESVVVGGGLGCAPGLYWASLVEAVRSQIWSEGHRDLPLVQAACGTHAGVIGAGLYALESRTALELGPASQGSTGAGARP